MTSESRIASGLFAATSGWLLFTSTLTAYLISAGASPRLALPFRMICHGIEERSLRWGETPMPLCARCFGIYLGFAVGLTMFWVVWSSIRRPMSLPALSGAILPLALDGTSQALLLWESTNVPRVLTGVLAGSGFMLWALVHIELDARKNLKRLKFETVTYGKDS